MQLEWHKTTPPEGTEDFHFSFNGRGIYSVFFSKAMRIWCMTVVGGDLSKHATKESAIAAAQIESDTRLDMRGT